MLAQVEERRQRLIKSFCAKAPVYENCRMLSHDGEPLSFIDYRKLAWYEVGSLLTSCDSFQNQGVKCRPAPSMLRHKPTFSAGE